MDSNQIAVSGNGPYLEIIRIELLFVILVDDETFAI